MGEGGVDVWNKKSDEDEFMQRVGVMQTPTAVAVGD